MRILCKEIDGKDSSGRIQICTDEAEDMYHAYNIIEKGDSLRLLNTLVNI